MGIEEIREALKSPEIKTALLADLETDALGHLKNTGLIVRTKEEEDSFLKSYETQVIDPRVKKIYDDFDKDIEQATGQKKPDGVKTYIHLKTVLTDLSAKGQRAKDLEAEIEQLKAGKVDDLTKQQLKQLQETVSAKEAELAKLQGDFKTQLFNVKHETAIEKALAGVKIFVPPHVPDAEKEAYVNSRLSYIKADFASKFKAEETDNGIVYKNAEGVLQTDAKTAAPKAAADLISETYKFEFEQEEGGKGGAGGSGRGKGNPGAGAIKDKAGIYEAAAQKGLVAGSQEWTKFVTETAKELNITI